MAVTDQLINTLFDERYKILRKLGAGGMANVYLAEDQELGRRVAIKILDDRHAADEQFVVRFRREAKNAAALSHQNIVSIYDRGEAEGTYYIAMEFLDGRSLKELIITRGPAPISIAIDYARQILAGLRFAHRHGIVHRDIKPHNVIVDAEGRAKVTDFGIAHDGAARRRSRRGRADDDRARADCGDAGAPAAECAAARLLRLRRAAAPARVLAVAARDPPRRRGGDRRRLRVPADPARAERDEARRRAVRRRSARAQRGRDHPEVRAEHWQAAH